jgi:4-hydroxy-2-oxoheptanedioate aldolase
MPLTNPIRERWAQNATVVNGWLSMGSAFAAEIIAAQGYDSVTVDMQHGMVDFGSAFAQLMALRGSGVAPIVRIPTLEPSSVSKALDGGALGIICPLVDTPEEAAQLVAWTHYPPEGERSFGPTRATIAYPDYHGAANREIVVLAMIETSDAVANLEAIVRTPGLDGVYIGPSDLTLGVENGRLPPGFDRQEPEMIDLIRRIIDTAHAAGIKAGLHCGSAEYAARAAGWGADLVTLSNDVRILAAAAAASVATFRELSASAPS